MQDILEIPSYIAFLISEHPFFFILLGILLLALLLRKVGYLSNTSGFNEWASTKNVISFSISGIIFGSAGGAFFFIYHYGFQEFFVSPPAGEVFIWLPPYVLYIIPGAFIGFTIGFLIGAWKGSRKV